MKINNHIVLDFNKTKQVDTQTIQCDMNSRFVRVSLRHNNSPIDLSDVRVCIMAVKPDGKEIFNDCTVIDAQNGIAEFEITKQMGIVVGEVECQIKLFGKEKLLSSSIFNLSVSKSLFPNSQDSKDQLNTLIDSINRVDEWDAQFEQKYNGLEQKYAHDITEIKGLVVGNDLVERMNEAEQGLAQTNAQLSDIHSNAIQIANVKVLNSNYSDDWGKTISDSIQAYSQCYLPSSTYNMKSPIKYTKEKILQGNGWSYGGSILKPAGDFPCFIPTSDNIDFTRNEFKNMMFDGANLAESTPFLKLNRSFLTTYEKIFFKASGVDIVDSDSIRFIDCRFMDGVNKDIIINIGSGARSINFIGCNFENYNKHLCRVIVNGGSNATQMTTNINFTNCQTERAYFEFDYCSNCVIDASKFHNTKIILGHFTNNCRIINIADATTVIVDYGMNNLIEGFIGENVAGMNVFKRNLSSDFKARNDYYGGGSDKEYLFITSMFPNSKGDVYKGKIQYLKSSGTVIHTTNEYSLNTDSTSLGTGIRHSYTDFQVFKCTENDSILVKVTAQSGDTTISKKVILKENLLENGSFNANTTTGWNFKNVEATFENGRLKLTITNNGEWGIYQSVSSLDENENYMCMAKISGGSLVVGSAWNGSRGGRQCLSHSHSGSDLKQMYLTTFKSCQISIGGYGATAGTVVYIDWVALVRL